MEFMAVFAVVFVWFEEDEDEDVNRWVWGWGWVWVEDGGGW
jgi:hypothetical protein